MFHGIMNNPVFPEKQWERPTSCIVTGKERNELSEEQRKVCGRIFPNGCSAALFAALLKLIERKYTDTCSMCVSLTARQPLRLFGIYS
jgi:hypothetical protein